MKAAGPVWGRPWWRPTTWGGMDFTTAKKRYNNLMEEDRDMFQHNKKAHVATDFPNATGNTTPPKEVFPK